MGRTEELPNADEGPTILEEGVSFGMSVSAVIRTESHSLQGQSDYEKMQLSENINMGGFGDGGIQAETK